MSATGRLHFNAMNFILSLILFVQGACSFSQKEHLKEGRASEESAPADSALSPKEYLGKLLFFDKNLSTPSGQACSDCHAPEVAFSNPEQGLPVSKGVRSGLYGNRNDMTVAYSAFIPPLHFDEEEGIWVGGLFWDGRANTLIEQAMGPPFNPLEMANPDVSAIAEKLRNLNYASLFKEVYGPEALEIPQTAFVNMSDAIAAYEKTSEVSPFSSKYDRWLRGETELGEQELHGLQIFEAPDKGNCAACHPVKPAEDGSPPLFTDFTYDNLGVPRNPENPFYFLPPEFNPDGIGFIDYGLGITVNDKAQNGKFRVPTLRNVAITPPYMHNGIFKTLFSVIAFYNTRDVAGWPEPEISGNMNTEEMGDLKLSNQEIEDLTIFLSTLTDDWDTFGKLQRVP